MRNRVVLPAPFGPIRPSTSPRASRRLTRSIARNPWKFTTTPVTESSDVVAAFADAAGLARQAGFDAVELHLGHGYLLQPGNLINLDEPVTQDKRFGQAQLL